MGEQKYSEIIRSENTNKNLKKDDLPLIRWYEENMTFETLREADEWVYSDTFNKIGYDYDGYKTTDPKLAYALLYHLIRANTLGTETRKVYADEKLVDNTNVYMVWVK
ncbi:hypothetical protein [Paenibacillus eucommiae]|uniref:Uncharacterized protein n=1 Tax=Paenibacillus eucommiae TaxID=1355755 RepID=A0ABS4IP42_9BACL|nr:hypothetical protein [Paenibacillus eucommiae]MBP1989328.1 hypothetical protein [Paenibacillus eucommiae]